MARQVSLTEKARDDLTTARNWQTQPGSGAASKRRMQAILTAIRQLKVQPCLYPYGADQTTREFSVIGHRVVYKVTPDTGSNLTAGDVIILRIFGPGQSRIP